MRFDQVVEYVARCRERFGRRGCKDCAKVLPNGLFLRGRPSLSVMVRTGSTIEALKEAMRTRGWYCRTCTKRKDRTAAAARRAGVLTRDDFKTEEEWSDYNIPRHLPPEARWNPITRRVEAVPKAERGCK